jgi:tetratricopeptide (TPR) repeat protein
MAKKVTRQVSGKAMTPKPPAETGPTREVFARWKLALAIVAAVALGVGAAFFWRGPLRRTDWRLPPAPSLEGKPAELKERFASAEARMAADPRSPDAVAEFARLYHANGFRDNAEACWRILEKAQPREARWVYYLADLRQMVSDDDGLKRLLEQTVQLGPNYAPAWLKLAELDFKDGRLDDAERAYQRTLSLIAGDPYARLGLSRIALQRGHRDEGKRLIEALASQTPDFPSVHNLYAEILAQEGDAKAAANQRKLGTMAGRFSAADDPWLEELRDWCYDATQLLVWGASDVQTNHRDRAETLFKRVIRVAPQDPRGYQYLGSLYQERGELAKAREYFDQGSKLPGASETLYARYSNTCLALNLPAEALSAVDAGLAALPGSAELLNARGAALEAAERIDEAVEAYRAASASRPSAADPLANLGISLLRLGRKDEAYACLQRSLELQPLFPKSILVLTRLEIHAENLSSAYSYIHPFFEQYPESNAARELMGAWYLKSALKSARAGDAAAAERAARDGLAADPTSLDLHGFLGVLLGQQNRVSEAVEMLETAHRLQPADLRVAISLADIYAKLGRIDDARQLVTKGKQLAEQRGDTAAVARCAEILKQLPE